jgi:hypothetical protein
MSNLPPHIRQKLAVNLGFGGRTASACARVTPFTSEACPCLADVNMPAMQHAHTQERSKPTLKHAACRASSRC